MRLPWAKALLTRNRIARVAADPVPHPEAAASAGWPGVVYYRLHGSPHMYYSSYDDAYLDRLAEQLREHATTGPRTWCIFDNTARHAATMNALGVQARLNKIYDTETGTA
ncbi:MAG TPA: DUF72 domain-containing protein [Pirellulales bacterium]|nr:DUF72 domain-containing protein [Pirellulales bacterium]